MNNFYAAQNQTLNCKTSGKSFSLKFRTQWLAITFAFFALLMINTNQIYATCNNVTNAGCIADNEANCGSYNPAAIINQASASGGSGTLEYVWKQSTDGGNTWTTISGATSSTYDPSTISVTTKYKRGSKRQYCSTYLWTNIVTKTVNPIPAATITYNGSLNLCTGGSIVLQASTGNGYDYKWYRNGALISGATGSSYTVTQAGNYKVLVNITATGCCAFSSEVCVTLSNCCDNISSGGAIGYDESNCGPFDPANIVSISLPSGGSGAIEYIWQSLVGQGPWVTVTGATSSSYDPGTISQLTCYRRLARRAGCTDYVNSNIVVKTVNPGVELACNMTNVTSFGASNGVAAVSISGGTAPYTYLWNNEATTASLTNVPAGVYSVTVTDANGCSAYIECSITQPPSDCTGFRTQTQGGWGQCHQNGNNPGTYLFANFASAFPSGLTVGCTNQLRLTSAQAVCEFLPSGSTPSALPSGTLTNPGGGYNNVLAGQVVALTLSVGFDQYDANFGPSTILLKNLLINSGTFAGWSVQQLLGEANRKLGGCSSSYSFSQLNEAVSRVNENFVDGNVTGSYLACCGNITASCSKTNVLCYGGNTGSVSVSASGATAPVSYLWSNGATTASVNNLAAGTYSVTVKDARNCTATCSVTVSQPDNALTAQCSSTDAGCYGASTGSVSVSAQGGTAPYTYLWSNGGTSSSLSGLSAGTYSVTVTDANGCTVNCSATVGQASALTAQCSKVDGTCNNNNQGSASVSASGGTAPYTYVWSTGATTSSISGLASGTYTVTVTDVNNCTTQCSVTVSTLPCCNVTEPGEIGYDEENCGSFDPAEIVSIAPPSGGLGSLEIVWIYRTWNGTSWSNWNMISGAAGLTYDPSGISVTTQYRRCARRSGCTDYIGETNIITKTVNPQPTAQCSKTDVVCYRQQTGSASVSASGGTAPYTYSWSNGATTASISGLGSGIYSVTVTDAEGCTANCSITIAQPNAALTVQCTKVDGTCNNNNQGSASVSASGGTAPYTYVWSNGATTSSINGLAAGTYSVTVTDAEGCSAQCSATVTITPCCNVTDGGEIGYDQENCGPLDVAELVTLSPPSGGLGNLEIVWITRSWTGSNWSNWEMISGATGLAYNPGVVTVTTQYRRCARRAGCTDYIGETNIITITINAQPTAQCSSVNGTCTNNNLGSASVTVTSGTAPFAYAWSNGATTSSISGLAAGTYSVTVTDEEGCSAQCSATVTVTQCCNVTNGGQIGSEQENCGPFDPSAITSIQDPTGGLGTLEYVWLYNHNQVPFNNGQNGWVEIPNSNSASYDPGQITQTTCYIRCSRRSGCTDYVGESNVICMIVNPIPTAQCSSVNGTCANNNLGSASVTVTSGTAPFAYAWSNGATTASINGLAAGTYSVTVTDAEGCSAQCSATVTITPCCNVTDGGQIGYDQENCGPLDVAELVTLSSPSGGLGNLEIVWITRSWTGSNWSNWEMIPGASGLTYNPGVVTVTTQYRRCARRAGCTDYIGESNIITITINPQPTAQCSSVNGTCTNNNLGSASVTVSSGTAPFSYVWSNGATTSSISGLAAGTYSVTVTDAEGCSAQCSATVTVTPCCNVTNGGQIGSEQENCGPFDPSPITSIQDPTGGLGTLEYVWLYNHNQVPFNNGQNGWVEIPNSNSASYDPGQIVQTTCYIRCSRRSGCTDYVGESNVICMIVNPVPTAQCSSVNGTCTNNNLGSASVTVTSGTAPFAYAWSNGATTSSISGLSAGTYSVTVTDAEGCSAQCSATVTVTPCCNVTDGGEIGYDQENCGPFDPSELVSLSPPTGGLGDLEVLWIYRVWTGSDWENDWHFVQGSHDLLSYDPGMITVSTQFRRCARRSGCEDYIGETNIITITINPVPIAQCSKTDVFCYGEQTGSASVSASGGTAPYTYLWNNGGTDAAISGVGAGVYSVTVTDAEGCTATCSVEVSQPQSALLANCEAGYVACYGESTGSAVVLAQGGTAPYSYLWSNGATNTNIDGLAAGSYSVTITDANGCTASCSIEVTQPEAPLAAQCSSTDASCYEAQDGTVSASVSGGTAPYSYSWSNGATTASVNNLSAGVYSVTVTDAEGCSTTCSVEVGQAAGLEISCSGTSALCNGDASGSASVSASGGTAPYSYLWSNGATTASVNGLEAGVYTVVVTDAHGCSDECSYSVEEPSDLSVQCSASDVLCFGGNDGSVSVSAAGGVGPYSYQWSNGSTDATANGLTAGTYSVTVTDANGCTEICTAVVGQPQNELLATCEAGQVSCYGAGDGEAVVLAQGGTAPYTYFWNNEMTEPFIGNLVPGTYTVIVTDANGCTATCSVEVTEPEPFNVSISADGPLTFCEGGSVTLTASEATSYVWSPNGETTQSIVVSVSGSYSVWALDVTGCEATSDPVSVVVNPNPTPEVSANGPTTLCEGECVTLTSTSASSYLWNNGATTQSITVCEAGDYSVSVVDENGCEGTSAPLTVIVNTVEPPVIDVDGDATVCAGECVNLTVLYSGESPNFLWSNGETSQVISVCETGTFTVTYTAENGCSATSEPVTVTVNPNPTPEVSAGGPTTFCEGECVTLTSSAASSYVWSNGATTQSITVCETDDYSVMVTDENGCQGASAPVLVVVNPNPTPIVSANGPTTFCEGECITLTSSVASSYVWSNGATTQSITVCEAGDYSVSVIDENGCEGTSAPAAVVVNSNPTPIVSASGPTEFCEGECVTLTSSQAANYLWSNGATTQSITVCEAGSFTVSVVDENGCEGTSAPVSVVVNPNPTPTVSADGPTSFCAGNCVTLTATSSASYLWTNGATTQSITVCESGDYGVSVVDENGCQGGLYLLA